METAHNQPLRSPAGQPRLRKLLDYDAARGKIIDGDLLLWRPVDVFGRLITAGTGGIYSHVAMAAWYHGVLLQFEQLQWHGGRAVTLSSQVRRWPGRCDVYRVNTLMPFRFGRYATEAMARRTGTPYGWRDFARIAMRQVAPWWPAPDGIGDDRPLVCSAAVAAACDAGGSTPTILDACGRAKPLWQIRPDELAEPFSQYQFTLVWEPNEGSEES